ncbi:transcriptional regulator, TetR family [Frankia torreyi]|uniref:Transcriptional regulator, TetR family n=1 Tax=Frankia torreyi TaxID=1856 RepID=A0A0D8B7B7_9ACTN|nr:MULTISPECIES: TetR/AcrR family transcriptional regulator [Frankia]KJE20188.1 transcriptional regulator, TetR family [Frankia torreyi]KQC34946.1 hypothetical protein UK82_29195 [Frankia sp. ACN1ag]KQM02462.1 transcriptional regulator, TetR family [Frankia sp. CpI1-P]
MRVDARRNRERLLTVAGVHFAEHGTGASLENIAQDAGVGIGTLYRHFETRQMLIEAMLQTSFERLVERGNELAGSSTPVDELTQWSRWLIAAAMSYPNMAAWTARIIHSSATLGAVCAELTSITERLLARARAAGTVRPDTRADDLVSLVNAVAWAAQQPPVDTERAERLLGVLLDGLLAR